MYCLSWLYAWVPFVQLKHSAAHLSVLHEEGGCLIRDARPQAAAGVCCEQATLESAHELEQRTTPALVSLSTICTRGTGLSVNTVPSGKLRGPTHRRRSRQTAKLQLRFCRLVMQGPSRGYC